jgi:hypothetical protein
MLLEEKSLGHSKTARRKKKRTLGALNNAQRYFISFKKKLQLVNFSSHGIATAFEYE